MNEALHEFLRVASGTTADAMFDELARLRRLGVAWDGVPETRHEFVAGLERLLEAGLAECSGKLVLWLPRREVERSEQKALW